MTKSILIVGMGAGLSLGVAEKFGKEGFTIAMISRSEEKLVGYKNHLSQLGITAFYAVADVADETQLIAAIKLLKTKVTTINTVHYNAVDYRAVHIMEDSIEALTTGFKISVANVLTVVRELLPDLKTQRGTILLTGGASATNPSPEMGSISLGKAGIHNLTYQLHKALKNDGIYVGTLTIGGWIHDKSTTHSPGQLANIFWQMSQDRNLIEIKH